MNAFEHFRKPISAGSLRNLSSVFDHPLSSLPTLLFPRDSTSTAENRELWPPPLLTWKKGGLEEHYTTVRPSSLSFAVVVRREPVGGDNYFAWLGCVKWIWKCSSSQNQYSFRFFEGLHWQMLYLKPKRF